LRFCPTVISILAFGFRRRASLEFELIGLRHQVSILIRGIYVANFQIKSADSANSFDPAIPSREVRLPHIWVGPAFSAKGLLRYHQ